MPGITVIIQRVVILLLSTLAYVGVETQAPISIPEEKTQPAIEQTSIETGVGEVIAPQNIKTISKEVEQRFEEVKKDKPETPATKITKEIFDPAPIDTRIENSVVKISCLEKITNGYKVHSGSGVFVDSKGVIITNAHVASGFLYPKSKMECSIKQGIIPTYGFKASLLYFPSDWARENIGILENDNPRGTGRDDYAFLAVTETTNPAISLPASFFSAKIEENKTLENKESVLVAGFPGTVDPTKEININSLMKKDNANIRKVYSFGADSKTATPDLISTSPSSIAQRGISGGGIFSDNKLYGLIVVVRDESDGTVINALTSSYIARDFEEDSGISLANLFSGNVKNKALNFEERNSSKLLGILTGN